MLYFPVLVLEGNLSQLGIRLFFLPGGLSKRRLAFATGEDGVAVLWSERLTAAPRAKRHGTCRTLLPSGLPPFFIVFFGGEGFRFL